MITVEKKNPLALLQVREDRDFALLPVFLLLLCCGGARGDQDWQQRFLSEAPKNWAALEEFYSHVEVECVTTSKKLAGNFPWKGYKQRSCKFRRNRGMIVWEEQRIDQQDREKIAVHGTNGQYEYRLSKTAGSETFHIDRFEQATENSTFSAGNRVWGDLYAPMAINSTEPLHHFMQGRMADVKFILKDVSLVQWGGRKAVSVQYELQSSSSDVWPERITAMLDPDNYWCLLEANWDNAKWKGTDTIEYGTPIEGYPIPAHKRSRAMCKTEDLSTETTKEYTHFAHRDVPESEFTLSAFNLPELQVPGQAPSRRNWLWFLLGAGVFSIVAVLLRYYIDKKRKLRANPAH